MYDESPNGESLDIKETIKDSDLDEQLIVSQIIAGEKELFRLLIRQHEKAVYGMGISFFRNHDDSCDFVQEVFLKVYKNLPGFEGRSKFSTWLYRIAYNTAINEVNRRKEYKSLAEEDAEKLCRQDDTPDRIILRNAVKEAVQTAVNELPERYRICVDLYFFYNCSYQEIESITGFPVNTVKSHVFRAKTLLRRKLESLEDIEAN